MKLLLTADPIGGVWTYALDLSRALAPHGVRVVLATMGAPLRAEQRRAVMQLANVELHASDFALEWMKNPWADVDHAGEWLLDLAAAAQPDLIHLNGYAHAALPWSAPVVVGAHSCVLSWWRAVRGEAAPNEWAEYRARVARGLQAADFVVAPTAAMRRMLLENYGPLPRSGVIANGRDSRGFRAGEKEAFIFSAGRFWDEAKNLATLGEAAPGLSWPVQIAGDGDVPPGLVRLGRLSPAEVAERLARAAIYCLPARYEPFGLSALEAAFSGCALVLGDIASLREVWAEAALYVPPNDAAALRATLQQLIEQPELRRDYAGRAQARAQRFSAAEMAKNYFALYSDLLRENSCAREAA